ncbi:hypothetical protein [Streptomyces sp. NPDC002913]
MAGVGPVDGTMRITNCYEAVTVDGYANGFVCRGVYTPRGGNQPQRDMTLSKAGKKHRNGSRVEVRTVSGKAYELSGDGLSLWIFTTWALFVPFLSLTIWLLVSARRARWAGGHGSIAFVFTLPLVALLLDVMGLVVEWGQALIG